MGNGNVLVVGGNGTGISAELYDPTSHTWRATRSAPFAPNQLVALPSGKILGIGVTSAAVYDPVSAAWSAVTPPRGSGTGVLLSTGKILMIGGHASDDISPEPSYLYDPLSGVSTQTGTRQACFDGYAAVLLASGKVLIGGGAECPGINVNGPAPSELYEPSTGTWTVTGAAWQVFDPLMVVMTNGKVLMAGGKWFNECGSCPSGSSAGVQLFDPVAGTWSDGTHLPQLPGDVFGLGTSPDSLVVLPDGHVLAAGAHATGGFDIWDPRYPQSVYSPRAFLFTPTTGAWTSTGSMLDASGRPGASVTPLRDGTVLAAGGTGGASAELYTPPGTPLPTSCSISTTGTDTLGHHFIRVAVRDVAQGLRSVRVAQSTNTRVDLPQFAPGSRDQAVVTATKLDPALRSSFSLQATTTTGQNVTCDPVVADLVRQRGQPHQQVFGNLKQAESRLTLSNGTPGLSRVVVTVNGQDRFNLRHLQPGETRIVDLSPHMRPGDTNVVAVTDFGPNGSSALMVISD
jgi:hypothetical protein